MNKIEQKFVDRLIKKIEQGEKIIFESKEGKMYKLVTIDKDSKGWK